MSEDFCLKVEKDDSSDQVSVKVLGTYSEMIVGINQLIKAICICNEVPEEIFLEHLSNFRKALKDKSKESKNESNR